MAQRIRGVWQGWLKADSGRNALDSGKSQPAAPETVCGDWTVRLWVLRMSLSISPGEPEVSTKGSWDCISELPGGDGDLSVSLAAFSLQKEPGYHHNH